MAMRGRYRCGKRWEALGTCENAQEQACNNTGVNELTLVLKLLIDS
jgi:hypothetical protein